MKSHTIRYEKPIGWIIELRNSDLEDRQAIVLESWDDVEEFCAQFQEAYANTCAFEQCGSLILRTACELRR